MAQGKACDLPSADASFNAPSVNASLCNFSIKLPSFKVGFNFALPAFALPFPKFGFALSCDPSAPISVSAGLEFGGGKVACFDVSPDSSDV